MPLFLRGRVIPPVSADAHDVLAVHLVATFLTCSKDSRMFGIESCQIRSSWVVWTQLGWASWTNSGLDKFVKLSPEFLDFLAVAHSLIVSYAVHLYGPCINLMGLPLGLLTWTRSYVVFSSLRQTLWSCFCWVNSLPIDFWRPPSVAFPSPIFIILFIDSKVSFFSVFRSFLIASSSSSFVNGCPSKSLSSWLPSLPRQALPSTFDTLLHFFLRDVQCFWLNHAESTFNSSRDLIVMSTPD